MFDGKIKGAKISISDAIEASVKILKITSKDKFREITTTMYLTEKQAQHISDLGKVNPLNSTTGFIIYPSAGKVVVRPKGEKPEIYRYADREICLKIINLGYSLYSQVVSVNITVGDTDYTIGAFFVKGEEDHDQENKINVPNGKESIRDRKVV